MATIYQGNYKGEGLRVGIAVARFNKFITERLLEGALDTLLKSGIRDEDIEIVWVPGSFELPSACKILAKEKNFDAVIALGAIIRGATSHFDLIASQTASGIQQVSLETNLPVIFGVVTAENIEQAIERAGTKAGNRGSDAAAAAVEMATLYRQLKR
ncbi:MAG: 6,7-dimethyl-8-ribityllumazine synthase [Candidatus Dadabacteria bacterium]|nr:MAG: 6,7-dimethyl-8-ribityllumazine synthase [Candidatus Dadabacteria bacterium]